MLGECRESVAKILQCSKDNVALIANATTGTNAVLRDLVYQDNDAIVYTSLIYDAVDKNVDYLIDTERMRGVSLHKVPVRLKMPMTKQDILKTFKAAIDEAQSQGKRIRIGVVDTISSIPGLRLPWEEMVKILKDNQILSLVDGAHGIGHIPINLSRADPDFFVSNCHKWLYAHRACAVLYVASRNFHLQRTSLPTSWFYSSNPSKDKNTWA
jgi:selenocysteine lyase/cysteine desulfurase